MWSLIKEYIKNRLEIKTNLARKLAEIEISLSEKSAELKIKTMEEKHESKCNYTGCDNKLDQRCFGKNCTYHCASSFACNGKCLNIWQKEREQKLKNENLANVLYFRR